MKRHILVLKYKRTIIKFSLCKRIFYLSSVNKMFKWWIMSKRTNTSNICTLVYKKTENEESQLIVTFSVEVLTDPNTCSVSARTTMQRPKMICLLRGHL